ncbi:NUDIX hydrolase [Pontibacillus halophilus]|nr:NUDIX domain-containing protein [Pontibacillus halophilus]
MIGNERVIMVVAGVFVINESEEVLLQLRSDHEVWGLPGGYLEMGESVQEGARREVYEETGLQLGSLELLGIYSGETQQRTLPNGDQVQLVKLIFTCRDFQGEIRVDKEESLDVQFFPISDLPPVWQNQSQEFADLMQRSKGPFIR